MDRRTTVKWMIAATAALASISRGAVSTASRSGLGYGTDPRIVAPVHAGEFWPLTLSTEQRQLVAVLADLIIPADEHSPSAAEVGVVDFIDEWVSAPYPQQQADRTVIIAGLTWLDAQAQGRGGVAFAALPATDRQAICDTIAYEGPGAAALPDQSRFFSRLRDLVAAGFYCTPAGRQDLRYIGNVALTSFEGPDPELLRTLGLL